MTWSEWRSTVAIRNALLNGIPMKKNIVRVLGARSRPSFFSTRCELLYRPLLILLLLTGTALAGDALDQTISLDIAPNTPLDQALVRWGAETGVQVMMSAPSVATGKTNGVRGTQTASRALTALLRDSGLSYTVDGSTVHVVPAHATDQSQPIAPGSRDAPKKSRAGDGSTQIAARQNELEEVIVTAQKRDERLQDVPVPVTAIAAQSLVEENKLTLQDYYAQVPGLNLTIGNTGAPNLSIRGVSTGSATNPTVGIVIDDVPFGSNTFLGYGFLAPDLDPSDLERIEVLRGPQGTLYGSSSIGGLLKYVTTDPSTDAFSGRLEAGLSDVRNGPNLGYSVRGSANLPVSDTAAVRASAFYHDDAGYIDNVQTGERGVNRGDSAGGHVSALWRPSNDFSVKLSGLVQVSKRYGSPDVYVQPGLGDLQQDVLRGTGGYEENIRAVSAIVNANVGAAHLTSATGYSVNKLHQSIDLSSAFGPYVQPTFGVTGVSNVTDTKNEKVSEEIRLAVPFGSHFDWLLGVFYTHESNPPGVGTNIFAVEPSSGVPVGTYLNDAIASTYTEYAAFTDLTVHFTDRFDVQFGGRESQNRQSYSEFQAGQYVADFLLLPSPLIQPEERTKDNAFTYLVTPRFKLSPDLMVYARLASGYRVGGPNQHATSFQLPLQFKPDKTQNYEVGFKGDFLDHSLAVDASLYYIDWKDIQLGLLNPISYEAYTSNASRAKSKGLELSIDARPWSGMTVGAWVTWNDATLTEGFPADAGAFGSPGDRLPYSSRFSGNVSVRQEFALTGEWTAQVGLTESYVGNRIGEFASVFSPPDRQVYPGYAQTDIRAGAKYETWSINLYVNNVADKRGQLAGGIGFFPANAFTYIQPRTSGLSIVKTF